MGASVIREIYTALQPIFVWFSSISAEITGGEFSGNGVANVVGLIAGACAAVVGVVFMWWGVRKVTHMIMSAFRSGRISL